MWALPADRKTFLDIFGKEPARHLRGLTEATHSNVLQTSEELLLLWGGQASPSLSMSAPGEHLPDAIMVRPNEMREFVAWVTTVIGGYRPFTAFFRIIDPQQAQLALKPKEPSLNRFENALVGLIIAETLTLSPTQRSVSALSLLPCQSTYSYSFARAFSIGYIRGRNGGDRDPIASPLALARRLTRQPARKLSDEPLSIALRVVSALATADAAIPDRPDVPPLIWETCQELQSHGELKRSWDLLESAGAPPREILNEMRGPREHRVRTFERILNGANHMDVLTSSFLAGLLADQIAPGTFEHVDLLVPYLNQYPMALVWYGLCAGLHPDSEVQQVGNCLGRRLVRDLLVSDPIISRPKYDLSVNELEVCLDREEPLEFRVASQNHIAVEVLPGVPAYMKWPVNASTEIVPGQSREMSPPLQRNQGELSLKPRYGETLSNEQDVSSERQFAIRELERAVERIKFMLKEPNRGGDNNPEDKGEARNRRKRH